GRVSGGHGDSLLRNGEDGVAADAALVQVGEGGGSVFPAVQAADLRVQPSGGDQAGQGGGIVAVGGRPSCPYSNGAPARRCNSTRAGLTASGGRQRLGGWTWTSHRSGRSSPSARTCTSAGRPDACSSPSRRCPSGSPGWRANAASPCSRGTPAP